MKITVVTKNMLNGGAERVIHNLICNWCKNDGIEMSLVLLNDRQSIFYNIPEKCKLNIIFSNKQNRVLEKLDRYHRLRKVILDDKPDVVLSLPEEIGIYVLVALFGTGIPIVVSERNNPWVMPYKKSTRFLRKVMYPNAVGFVFQTNQAASFFSEKIQQKGIVLPNPLDIENLPEPFTGEREKVVVGAGRLERQKNFPLLIDAFAKFYKTHPEYKLVIFGEGSLRSTLEQYAKSKQLPEGTISFPGRSEKLIEEIRNKAMFVLSSDFEGMPNVVIEAMAVGIPVISTDCPSGGSADLIEDGTNGILVPVGDVSSMTSAMCKIANNNDFAKKLRENSVTIKEKLHHDIVCSDWLEYLQKVCR